MMVHYLFKLLVIENKVVSYEYFMDKMEEWEIYHFVDNLIYNDKNEWEKARMMMYVIAQVNSTKKLKPSDIISFPWDKDNEYIDHSISNSDIERLTAKAKKIEEELNNGRKQ